MYEFQVYYPPKGGTPNSSLYCPPKGGTPNSSPYYPPKGGTPNYPPNYPPNYRPKSEVRTLASPIKITRQRQQSASCRPLEGS